MRLSRFFSRSKIRPVGRPLARRRPLVEALEGRELLTTLVSPDLGIVGNHIGTNVSAIVGNHIGTNVIEVMIKH